ncbi:MAG: flagellar hook-basal body complex protein [Pseudomonadales bacterium]
MAFNIALSGLNAASSDLRITGNNIANSSTVGFKASRAEFADVYSSSLLGAGDNQIGSGVKLGNISQQFDQGTISFTNNSLDLAIDGNGFFVLSDNGARAYTRAGAFSLDDQGFIVSNSGSLVQGFTANESGALSGILGDMQIETNNIAPRRTGLVEATVNLDARADVLSQTGSLVTADGAAVGVARPGLSTGTPTVLDTAGPPTAFDYSQNTASNITSGSDIIPFDFSANDPSAVSAAGTTTGFDFSLNTPSSLTGSGLPGNFNFADKPSAISGTSSSVAFDYSGANSASFDVTIAGSGNDGTATVTLNSNITSVSDLVTEVNAQLTGIGAQVRADPNDSSQIQFIASTPGQNSTLTVDSFAANGAASTAILQSTLSDIADGSQSVRSSFDVSISGSSADGTASIQLTSNIGNLPALIADITDQLSGSGIAVAVREDPNNSGRLQFYSTDNGVASDITVDNLQTTDAGVTVANIASVLRLTDGASSSAPGAGAIGAIGSLTASSFDVTLSGGSGAGGNASATVTLNQSYANGDIGSLINDINTQLNAVPGGGIDVVAQEDPANPGRIQFAATVPGETSTVVVDNFQTSGVAGDVQTSVADISAVLGGITQGSSDNSGNNTAASFQVSMTGSNTPGENQTVLVTLDNNISTLQDLINDIRDDLSASGIGIDVREDPNSIGRLQFYALNSGESSTIRVDPNDNAIFGIGVTSSNVQAALGGITLGNAGNPGASNVDPDPFNNSNTVGSVGNVTQASFDITVSGSAGNNGTATIRLDSNIQTVDALIADVRDDLLTSGLPVDVREDPNAPGRMQFFSTIEGEASSITISNLDASNIGVTQADLSATLNLATGVSLPGVSAVNNGYAAQAVDVIYPDGSTQTVNLPAGQSAAQMAAAFGSTNVSGVTATASTLARIPAASFSNASGTLAVSLNGVSVAGTTLTELADSVNSGLPGLGTLSASLDVNGDLVLNDALGNDVVVALTGGGATDGLSVVGEQGNPVVLNTTSSPAAAVGGQIELTLEEGVTLANAVPAATNVFGLLNEDAFSEFELNTFDPTNQDTYNSATSVTIFDSLGNPHILSMYYVKDRFDPEVAGDQSNRWTVYALIDGEDVGDPDPNLPPPENTVATRASFNVQFNDDGSINTGSSEPMLISNWQPLSSDGLPNGADGPLNTLAGGALPVADPATSSNFEIRLGDSTQYGSDFAVAELDQDGYTTGEISGLNIDDEGVISARFTNGQNQVLGQIAIADFSNVQGLAAVGDTAWVETNDSGEPVIAAPGSGSLGVITSGALEDSNVELSEQLVQLIIAQRNFQANARTISTSDEITQTIINI